MAEIKGQVRVANGLAAQGVTFQLLRERFGAEPEVVATVVTDETGQFAVPDLDLGEQSTLTARLQGDGVDGAVLLPVTGAQDASAMRLVVPADRASFASEHRRLVDAVTPVLGGAPLAAAQENDDRQDVSLIHRQSGWDARLVALSVMASRLSQGTDGQPPTGLDEQALYGLLRAGLPSDRTLLARVRPATVRAALDKAAAAKVVDLDPAARDAAVTAFEEFATAERLAARPAGGLSTTAELLDASGLGQDGADSPRSRFEKALFDPDGGQPLWARAAAAGLDDDTIGTLQSQAKLAFLTTNNAPLMSRLQPDVAAHPTLAQSLVSGRWDEPATWATALTDLGGTDVVPPAFRDDEDPVQAYSAELARRVRVAYPTHVVAALVDRAELPIAVEPTVREAVATTLQRAGDQGFRLGATHAQSFLAGHADVLEDVDAGDRPKVAGAIATLQRAFQISPSNEAMKVLLEQNLASATDVVSLSSVDFIGRYGALFPSEREARLVHRKAEQVSAVLYNFYSMTRQVAAAPALAAVSGTPEEHQAAAASIAGTLPAMPTLESLFGSMDYCECDHCRSVLGPAAYLVDLLQFVDPDPLAWEGFRTDWARRHNGQEYPFGTPYEELTAHRPDLAHLQLSCENTNTELPLIDLVNEVLEFLVADRALTAGDVHDSGAVQSADVMSEPEFVLDAAYERLRGGTFPSVLPFDVWHETVRGFLGWLNAPLADLLDLFGTGDGPGSARYGAAIERLGLTPAEADVLTDPSPLAAWWTRFGFEPGAGGETAATATLGRAKQLARRLGVSYQDLVDLLGTHFLNPSLDQLGVLTTAGVSVADAVLWRANGALVGAAEPTTPDARELWSAVSSVQERLDTVSRTYALTGDRAADAWLRALPADAFSSVVVLADPDSSCDFERTLLGSATTGEPLAADRLADVAVRLDLLARLRRATTWSLADLDQALRAFLPTHGPVFGEPMRTALMHLGTACQVEARLGTDPEDRRRLIALWCPLTTSGPRPLYEDLFLRGPAARRDPAFAAPLGDVLSPAAVAPDTLLSAHLPALQGALGLSGGDAQDIADRHGPAWATTPLSLAAVSDLHRVAFLARASGRSVSDLLALQRLSGTDPLPLLDPDAPAPDGDGDPLGRTLDFIRTAAQLTASGLSVAEVAYLFAHHVDPAVDLRPDPGQAETLLDGIATRLRGALDRTVAGPAETDAAPDDGPPPPPPTPAEIAAGLVASALGPRGGLVAALLTGPSALADPAAPEGSSALLVEAFLGLASPDPDRARATAAHLLLTKVLLAADRLGLTARECLEFGLGALPLAAVDGPAPGYAGLRRLLGYLPLRRDAAGGTDALIDVLVQARTPVAGAAADRLDAAAAALAALTRRRVQVVSATAAALGLGADDLDVDGLGRLWQGLLLVERLGVEATVLSGWLGIAAPATSLERRQQIAREVRDAVRSHLGPARWRQVARPISDRLRQRQRDALVATVLHDRGLATVDELYQWLLLDPGAEPVLRTTRIRQAISSLQLFVQRCLLNLEPRVHPSALNADHWEWMKRYRVWEANRKIFLYPENWLEPEFRDDKTHLFRELEGTLLQTDVSSDVVEDAFLVYLRSLEEIARLDVVGFHTEQDPVDPGSTTLHVIGRTHNAPHQFFYRRLQHGMWTPWEPMRVDIQGDHVVPAVWRNRLHVFWVTFVQKSDDADSGPRSLEREVLLDTSLANGTIGGGSAFHLSGPVGASRPAPKLAEATVDQVQAGTGAAGVRRQVDVQLNWSEYVRGTWSTTSSGGFGRVPAHSTNGVFDPESVFVHTSILWEDDEEAGVQVHLSGGMTRTFLLRGRNSVPEAGSAASPPAVPYKATAASINRYRGSSGLTVTFAQKLTSVDGAAATPTSSTLSLLGRSGPYTVLPSGNGIAVGAGDIGSLVSPFFFQDARRTFFVEPALLETTTETWEEWIVPDPEPGTSFDPEHLRGIDLVPWVPQFTVPVGVGTVDPLRDTWPELLAAQPQDLITSPDVGVLFDDTVLGARGGIDLTVISSEAATVIGRGRLTAQALDGESFIPVVTGQAGEAVSRADVDTAPGFRLVPERTVLVDHAALASAGLSTDARHLTVLSGGGFNAAQMRSHVHDGFGR